MKSKLALYISLSLLFLLSCGKSDETYTIKIRDGVKYVHNHASLWGDEPKVALEFVQKIGGLDVEDENYQIYRVSDITRDTEGNIYLLESKDARVKKFDSEGMYVSTISRKGQGPGEISSWCTCIDMDASNKLYIADYGNHRIHIFTSEGEFIESHRMIKRVLSFRLLNTGDIVTPNLQRLPYSTFSTLVNVIDTEGNLVRTFGEAVEDNNPLFKATKNLIALGVDSNNNIYVVFGTRNRIEKYSPEGELLFRADRPTNCKVTEKLEMKTIVTPDGSTRDIMQINFISREIGIDGKGRLWVVTHKKQLPEDLTSETVLTDIFEFHIFDSEGVFLGTLPIIRNPLDIFDDRLYLFDDEETCLYEYKIVEK